MNNLVLELLSESKDSDLMMSKFNCHVKGLHSIVLKNNHGILTRCFFTEKDHTMHLNINSKLNLPLGIHNHRYGIRLNQVSGEAVNILYKENKPLNNISKFKYDSEILGGSGASFVGFSGVEVCGVSKFTDIYMAHHELHTVFVPKGCMSSWVVMEGDTESMKTDLFQNGSVNCSKYKKPENPDQVREFIHNFYK